MKLTKFKHRRCQLSHSFDTILKTLFSFITINNKTIRRCKLRICAVKMFCCTYNKHKTDKIRSNSCKSYNHLMSRI